MFPVLPAGRDRIRRDDYQIVRYGPTLTKAFTLLMLLQTPLMQFSEVLTSAPPPIKVSVKCDDILRELLADEVWHWTYEDSDESSSILDDLMRHINFCALQRYTETRDCLYRADAELPP
jgi:hypothetical protein